MFRTAVKILEATVGIRSNKPEALPIMPLGVNVESLLTDFHKVEEIPTYENMDGTISVLDGEGKPAYEWKDDHVVFKGPFSRLQKKASDSRYTLWGNQGFLYRYTLFLLEYKHHIYNLHACALYQEDTNTLFVVTGGAGSGKTVYLLSGLERGMKLFASETVHFRRDKKDIVWYMGSLLDNVRYGTLVHDFPRFLVGKQDIPVLHNQWQQKIAVDLSPYRTKKETIVNPSAVRILFPRVEKGFLEAIKNPVEDKQKAKKVLFDNITQKITETTLLYDKLTVLGLDSEELANARLQAVNELVNHRSISEITAVISSPQNCWEKIL